MVVFGVAVCSEGREVKLERTPNEGLQPRVVMQADGTRHLVYYLGKPEAGDLFYQVGKTGAAESSPVRVNSISASAISMGTIRGAQLAVDSHGIPHFIWNGSNQTRKSDAAGPALYYTHRRTSGERIAFMPQQTISAGWPVDGGGAIAADHEGRVFVLWHSGSAGATEQERRIFLRISSPPTGEFGEPRSINPPASGVCPCCAMQAATDREGRLYVVYRAARQGIHRDIILLISEDGGLTFQSRVLDRWELSACPMSSMAFGELENRMLVGWEKEDRVKFSTIAESGSRVDGPYFPSGEGVHRKHPVFAISPQGTILLAWTEETGWNKGGSVAWQIFNDALQPAGGVHRLPAGVSVWSFAAAYFHPGDQTFHIMH